ncbi:hypothetical protein Tco_0620630 [Tanacetum coccineum]
MAKQQENQQQERPDEELVPATQQVKIRLRNYRISLEKQQPDVIQRCLAILKHYLQLRSQDLFFALDDQIFEVNEDLLHDALQITPKDSDHPFVTPSPHDDIV